MIKSVIKEIFIILLLMVAIVLVLGVMFYDYRPTTKKIPSKVAEYKLPQEMEEELEETLEATKTQNIIKTYRVDSGDLKKYEYNNQYNKGKVNPFDKISSSNVGTGNTSGGSSSSGSSSSGTGNQGSFLNTVK